MAQASHWHAANLAAVSCLAVFLGSTGAAGQTKQSWADCNAREIAAVVRGCTATIKSGAPDKSRLAQARLNRGKAYAKRGSFTEAIADFAEALRLAPRDAEAYRERGSIYSEQKENALAEADFAAAIRLNPNGAKAYAQRGWHHKSSGDEERAKSDFEQALKLADKAIAAKQDLAQAHYWRAVALAGLGDYGRAIAEADEAIKLKPDDEAAYTDRGIIYSLKGGKDRAAADLNKALELQPAYWHALNGRGNLFIQAKDYERAIADSDAAIAVNKDNPQAYALRGYANREKGDFERAIADYSEAIRLNPKFDDAFANRAWAYLNKKDADSAIADFTRAIELKPKDAISFGGRASAYAQKKDMPHAMADYDAAIAIDSSSQNYERRGLGYEQMGEYAKAVADLNEAISLKPDNWLAYSDRGRNYGKLGDYAKQIADFKELIRLNPDYDTIYISLAQAYDNKGEPDRAIAVLDKYLQKKPDDYMAHSVRVNMHIALGEIDEAIADTNELIRLKGNAEAYHRRATAYMYKKDYDRAIADLTQAIRLDPDNEENNYFLRAGLFNSKGDYARAIADMSEFIRLSLARLSEPRFSEPSGEVVRKSIIGMLVSAHSFRAMYRLNMGDKENALADCNEAIRQWPDRAAAYSGRGRLYYWQKQDDLAIQDSDKALQFDPGEAIARSIKALALLRLGRLDDASEEVATGLRTGKDRDSYLAVRGEIAYEQGKYGQAADDLTEAMKFALRKLPTSYMQRGRAYEKLGQKTLAMADYKTAVELDASSPTQREARIEARERLGVLEGEMLTAQPSAPTQPHIDPGRRIALVIGVGAYQNAPGLRNPPNDAAAVAKAFRELGFAEVIEVPDPSRAKLEAAIMAFGDKAADADWAVVFYAGHGMQVEGHNFLIPADAKLESDRHVDFETVALERVINSLSGTKKLGLVILDACRDNPFLKRMRQTRSVRSFGQGLAAVEPSQGQMIVYATKDGSVAEDGDEDHSPFTKALLAHIGEARLDIRLMFSKVRDTVLQSTQNRQQPFTYGSLPGEGLFFKVAEN